MTDSPKQKVKLWVLSTESYPVYLGDIEIIQQPDGTWHLPLTVRAAAELRDTLEPFAVPPQRESALPDMDTTLPSFLTDLISMDK